MEGVARAGSGTEVSVGGCTTIGRGSDGVIVATERPRSLVAQASGVSGGCGWTRACRRSSSMRAVGMMGGDVSDSSL